MTSNLYVIEAVRFWIRVDEGACDRGAFEGRGALDGDSLDLAYLKGRYRYESHGLRFDVKRPTEDETPFRMRINMRARDEEEGTYEGGGSDPAWRLGTKLRHLGSIHSDTWIDNAAEFADRGILAIYPALGWWKTAKKLERYNKQARYALVVSIKAPEANVDLYNVITQAIAAPITVVV